MNRLNELQAAKFYFFDPLARVGKFSESLGSAGGGIFSANKGPVYLT